MAVLSISLNNPIKVALHLRQQDVPHYSFSPEQVKSLAEALSGSNIVVCNSSSDFAHELKTAVVSIAWYYRQEWVDAAANLRWLATPSAGRDYFNVVTAPQVRRTYGSFHGALMAETVAAMVLAESRGLLAAAQLQARGEHWQRREVSTPMRSIRNSHAVIVGFGSIGQQIGKLLRSVGIRISGIRRNTAAPRPDWMTAHDTVSGVAKLDSILPSADHLIFALPGDTGTDNLLNAERLARLPPSAVVYNVGRGNVINETALAHALRSNRLRAACLDVFAKEPLPRDSLLLSTPRLYVMPHVSAAAPDYFNYYIDELKPLWGEFLQQL